MRMCAINKGNDLRPKTARGVTACRKGIRGGGQTAAYYSKDSGLEGD